MKQISELLNVYIKRTNKNTQFLELPKTPYSKKLRIVKKTRGLN